MEYGNGRHVWEIDNREGEKFAFRLVKARHWATHNQDIGVVKSVEISESAILKKPGEARRRWKGHCDRLFNEEYTRNKSSYLRQRLAPSNSGKRMRWQEK
ncbi:hypothetical protein V3C99_017419 [Haemonchus contortus]|uniref:Phage protein n=1 Tax=Haemonchus contortus TaxID=6289 RepID=A0A7I4Z4I6_HAECO